MFPHAHPYATITQTETENIYSTPGGSSPGVSPHPEGHLGLPRQPLLVSPSAPFLCKGFRTWKSTYWAMWREVVAQAHSHGGENIQNGRGQGTEVAGGSFPWGEVRACPQGARGPCSTPSYCLVGWDSISRAWGPKRAETVAGVPVLHIKQCWSLTLPGIQSLTRTECWQVQRRCVCWHRVHGAGRQANAGLPQEVSNPLYNS